MKLKYTFLLTALCSFFFLNSFAQQEYGKSDSSLKITIAPNPVNGGYFILESDSCNYDHFNRLVIYNSSGYIMQNKQLQMLKGSTKQHIDVSGFAPGNYYVRIIDNNNPTYSFAEQILVQ